VYAVDSRNHGDSPWSDVFNFDCNVDDLLSFMDSIGAPKAIIIGHSMGGITGMKTALRAPERVEKLVVEDISCRKIPQPILEMVLLYVSLGQAALEQVPTDVDEDTARKIIFDAVLQGLPQELKMLAKPENANFRIQLKRSPEGRWIFKSNIGLLMKALKNSKELMTEPTGVYEGPACFIYGKLSPFLVCKDCGNLVAESLLRNSEVRWFETRFRRISVMWVCRSGCCKLNFLSWMVKLAWTFEFGETVANSDVILVR
ncbi:hypothetical protein AVEN_172005-1, partial [Araneus ventricosus]